MEKINESSQKYEFNAGLYALIIGLTKNVKK